MKASIALATIRGIAPYSASRMHDEPKLDREAPDAYDRRTWRSHLHVQPAGEGRTVVIPGHAIHQALASAASYTGKKITGRGNATWSRKFRAGIAVLEPLDLGIDPETVEPVLIHAHSTGVRGSGSRVKRHYPLIERWGGTMQVYILDQAITREEFGETLEVAGMFIGLGRFRPENSGTNGRFVVDDLDWQDNRELTRLG